MVAISPGRSAIEADCPRKPSGEELELGTRFVEPAGVVERFCFVDLVLELCRPLTVGAARFLVDYLTCIASVDRFALCLGCNTQLEHLKLATSLAHQLSMSHGAWTGPSSAIVASPQPPATTTSSMH